nr:RNA-directed DNA polymerase, eukaryota, reverse transcriptase zinc-binding domain protein [Tanacetum cinerariifolium]
MESLHLSFSRVVEEDLFKGDNMSRIKAWDDIILKIKSRLIKWKVKTLSIGGRLTLLKSVLGASPIYAMSIFTVPHGVLKALESIRNRFFNGADQSDHKITNLSLTLFKEKSNSRREASEEENFQNILHSKRS